ncbi:VanZ family protein [Oryzobacter telluris]|uniref:VanZ family protein n=1 Tax=Oryzobacter telluris TaxID=3149179 RepID=UPI00370D9A7B
MRRAGGWVAAGVTAVIGLGVLAVLLWPDGYAVNRAIVAVYVVFQRLGVPGSVTPEVYAAVLNVLAFVPLGWLGVVALRRRPSAVFAALVLMSVGVEAVQALPGLARDPSVVDVVLNGLGAALGVGLGTLVRSRRSSGDDDPA